MTSTEIFEYVKELNVLLNRIDTKAKASFHIFYTDAAGQTTTKGYPENDNDMFDIIQEEFDDELLKIIYNAFLQTDLIINTRQDYNMHTLVKDKEFEVTYFIRIVIEDK